MKGAYLIPDIVEGSSSNVHLWIEYLPSGMFVEIYPELRRYVYDKREACLELQKFYFHQHLSARMKELGFVQLYVCAHVDDLMAIRRPAALLKLGEEIK